VTRELAIPTGALSQHVIVLGKTRSGKSSVMRLLVEQLLDDGKPVCIIDPKGDWWGLKSSATGKSAGYPVIIFGGAHADVPLNPRAGAPIAELIATGNRPCIIDLKGWMVGDRTRFFIDFASTLFRHTRGPRWLIIDEVHNFAPQGKVLDPDAGKMLHWTNRLINEGSGLGLTLISASQRPQKVHKDFVTANETLIAMRVIHPLDRGAVADWIKGCPDVALGAEVLGSLASMVRGEGWVWSPEINFGPKRIRFSRFRTYDSFAAPVTEATTKLSGWASVDLDEVKSKLATFVEEAQANDPKLLKAEIVKLRAALATAKQVPVVLVTDIADAEQRGYAAGYTEAVELVQLMVPHWESITERVKRAWQDMSGALLDLIDNAPKLREPTGPPPAAPLTEGMVRKGGRNPVPSQVTTRPPPPEPLKPAVGLSAPQQRLLDAIAWWNAIGHPTPSRAQVALVASYKPNTGTFNTYMSSLVTAELIDYPTSGRIVLTAAGARIARAPDQRPDHIELMSRLGAVLSGPQMTFMKVLAGRFPQPISREDLGLATAYQVNTGTFNTYLSSLKTLGLIAYPKAGEVIAVEWLFP
jgi:hypothetical protein